MEYFYGGGGNSNPHFRFRIKVDLITNEMYHWCQDYPESGHFCRWHTESHSIAKYRHPDYDIVQFEAEKPAKMFALLFGDSIL